MSTPREIMTPEQVAEYLQVNRETVYRYIRDGKLRAAKIGRHYRVPKTNVDKLIEESYSWNGIPLRTYTDEEIEQFLIDDQLTEKQSRIVEEYLARHK